jgi:hypothetical protein
MRKNPVTMVGNIERCWLFAFHTPADEARKFLPRELDLVTRDGCAFWNVVFCQLRGMRPQLLPAFLGNSCWHVGYRLYVRFQPASGEPIEGLYFVRSDCNSRITCVMGNVVTDYKFNFAQVSLDESDQDINLTLTSSQAPARVTLSKTTPPQLPPHSLFSSLDKAAAFLKYKPFGISVNANGTVNVVKIVRNEADWKSRLLHVQAADWKFFDDKNAQPEICYQVEPIAYQWNRAQVYRGGSLSF